MKLLERVGLSAHANKFPAQLPAVSNSVWRSLAHCVWILLPAVRRTDIGAGSGDDQRSAGLMVELANEGMTMMVVTHEMGLPVKWRIG